MTIGFSPTLSRCRCRVLHTLFLLCSLLVCASSLQAQVSTSISSFSPSEAVSESPLVVRAELRHGETIERVYFLYRSFTESGWTRVEMELMGNTAIARVPPRHVSPPFLEYYIVLVNRSGQLESYPVSENPDPLSNAPGKTLQLPVMKKEDDVQAVFLSPEPNASYETNDVLISVSLYRADTMVVKRATQLFLNNTNVTRHIVISDDILVYVPANHGVTLKPGRYTASVLLYNRQGLLHRQVTTSFNVLAEGQPPERGGTAFVSTGSVDLELRREKVNREETWYNRGNFRFNGSQGAWRFNANAFVTSDERLNRQPQNRYYAGLESKWLLVGYGDSYPYFPSLILNGKRVRGLNSAIRLGKFNVEVAAGRTVRDVEGTLLKVIPIEQLAYEQQIDSLAAYAKIDSLLWGKYNYGTYSRSLFAVRPSFGSGETYQIGFTWLKSKDDINSIRYGTRPKENLVLGADLLSRFDNSRIELTGQFAFSAYNNDISSGSFTDAYIDSVYKKDAAAIKNARDILKSFITVNDNLRPLSFKKLSTVAYDVGLALNYFDNAFRINYQFRGSDYNSFGQTFLRTDIAGFNITDRIKLPAQNLFITLGYERLSDNTSKSKAVTTHFTTYNVAVNYDPRSILPSIAVGFTHYRNINNLSPRFVIGAVDDQTNRLFVLLAQRFNFHASHTASISLSGSKRNDYTPQNLDVRNTSVALNLNTRYRIPLQTTMGFTHNYNNYPGPFGARMRLRYTNVFANGVYTLPDDVASISCTVSPTFGDFKRVTFDLSAQWAVARAMNIILQYSLFGNIGLPNDDFWSVKYRFDF